VVLNDEHGVDQSRPIRPGRRRLIIPGSCR